MKRTICLYLPILLLLVLACTPRKSSEEAERFLQTALSQQKGIRASGEEEITPVALFNAEQEYRFTPVQRLQLKRILLAKSYRIDREMTDGLCAEAEAIALQTGNDSLLCVTRWDIFRYHQAIHDTTAALDVLQRQAPLVRTLYGEENLKPYYYALANMYNYHNRPAICFHWLRKARPAKATKLHIWYNQMANALLRFNRNDDALAYADSSLATWGNNKSGASGSCLIKGQALRNLGRSTEAMHLYAVTVATIDSLSLTRKSGNYSNNELYIFYDYASLLQQAGRYHEAIPLLARVAAADSRTDKYKNTYSYYTSDIETPPINASRLLSQCYYSLGQKDRSIEYARRADSLQNATNEVRRKINEQRIEEIYRNKLLSSQLSYQQEATAAARRMQYVLSVVVILLAAALATAGLWWHKRRQRLRQLFILMAERHADWLSIRSLLLEQPHPDPKNILPEEYFSRTGDSRIALPLSLLSSPPLPESEIAFTADTEGVYRRIFHRVLRIMENEQPFLDPKFDLIALSRLAGTNRTQLSTAINQQAQTSFSNWLAAYRVNYLIQQIDLQPDCYIDEIYPQAGFASRTTFYRQFRQATGLTPKQYMKERTRG